MEHDRLLETRRHRLRELIDLTCDGNASMAARTAEIDATYIARALWPVGKKGRKTVGERVAHKIEDGFKLPRGWLDSPVGTPVPPRAMEAVARYGPQLWPFTLITPEQWAWLDAEDRLTFERAMLTAIRTREPPSKHHKPETQSAAA